MRIRRGSNEFTEASTGGPFELGVVGHARVLERAVGASVAVAYLPSINFFCFFYSLNL